MVVYIPIIGAIALATGTIFEKIVLRKKKIEIKQYQTLSFLAIVLAMLPFIYFFWKMTPEAFETKNMIIFGLVIISSIIATILIFYTPLNKVFETTPLGFMNWGIAIIASLSIVIIFNILKKINEKREFFKLEHF